MGWQRRGSRTYYYWPKWSEGRARNEYVGRGPLAELLAEETENRRSEQRRARQELDSIRERLRPLDELLQRLERVTFRLIEAELRSRGYYRSHRNWRGARRAREFARRNKIG
jgi:hypothetical protein